MFGILDFSLNDFHEYRLLLVYFSYFILCSLSLSQWEPSKLEFVSDRMVDSYFSKVDDEGWEDLKFPARSNLHVYAIAKL